MKKRDTSIIRIGIVGSKKYENKRKIKDMIFKLKTELGNKMEIVSAGSKDGAEKYIRSYAIEFGCEYKEFLPSHWQRTLYSAMGNSYFGKPYKKVNFFIRDNLLAKYIDYLIIFDKGTKENINLIKNVEKLNKKIVIIS